MHRIIPRAEWGARYDNGFHNRALPARIVGAHHSVTIAPDLVPPWDDDYAAVRQLEDIGESRFGAGISYTWAITPAGLIFEGHSPHRSGAHTLNLNDVASAICWIGRYDTADLTEEQVISTVWLLVHAKRQGWIDDARIDGGHGQLPGQSTDCPGKYGRAAIARINQLAAAYERGEIDLDQDLRTIGEEAMLIKDITRSQTVALVSGGIVSGVDTKFAEQTNEKANGGILIGVSADVWDDLVRKSQGQEAVPHLLSEVLTATQDNTSLLREVLAALKARA